MSRPGDQPVNTGFGRQIVKCAVVDAVFPRESLTVTLSVNNPGCEPWVLTLTEKLALVGAPGNVFVLIVRPPRVTVAVFSPALACTVIGKLRIVPDAWHDTIDLVITVGCLHGGL